MRLVATLPEEQQAQRFSNFLTKEKIENHIEISQSPETKQVCYTIWVVDEDQLETASNHFQEFQKDPTNERYTVSQADLPSTDPESPPPPDQGQDPQQTDPNQPPPRLRMRYTFTMTGFFLMVCVVVYFLNSFQEMRLNSQRGIKRNFLFTPIQRGLMYDVPLMFIELENFIEKERINLSNQKAPVSPEIAEAIQQIEANNPYWRGLYGLVLHKLTRGGEPYPYAGPLFEKIRQGQIWRVFSPCILHRDLLHILFNMVWLWVLGKQLDLRLNKWQFLFLVLVVGIVSNTGQYLMSGPLFMGFSGVITGMAGFIWVRQKVAPWEGYTVHRSTFLFLGFFILIMFLLQAVSFIFEWMNGSGFAVSIANTAHILGALVGMLLAKVPWFAWRPK